MLCTNCMCLGDMWGPYTVTQAGTVTVMVTVLSHSKGHGGHSGPFLGIGLVFKNQLLFCKA